jgi:hypothetical protein
MKSVIIFLFIAFCAFPAIAADEPTDPSAIILNAHIIDVQTVSTRAAEANRETPLMIAAEKNYVDLAKVLLENGADINATDAFGYTALLYADSHGSEEMAQYLLSKGADVPDVEVLWNYEPKTTAGKSFVSDKKKNVVLQPTDLENHFARIKLRMAIREGAERIDKDTRMEYSVYTDTHGFRVERQAEIRHEGARVITEYFFYTGNSFVLYKKLIGKNIAKGSDGDSLLLERCTFERSMMTQWERVDGKVFPQASKEWQEKQASIKIFEGMKRGSGL